MNEWNNEKLGNVCTKIGSGSTPTGGANVYKNYGCSLIRSQNVIDFAFSNDGLVFIDDIQAKKLNGVTIEKGDVLLNITGDSVARSCIVPDNVLPARVNQHVSIIRTNKNIAINKFVFYFIQYIKPFLLSIGSNGGTRNALTKVMIEQLDIPLPPLPEQRSIADTLSCLDDMIELNNRTNKVLEEMAQAIFKRWFIDFEFPDENGNPYKSSGGTMEESELGVIPVGWEKKILIDIIDIRDGTHDSPKPTENGYPLITSKHLCAYGVKFEDTYSISENDYNKINQRSVVEPYDILISMIGTVGNISYIMYDEINFAIKNVGLFKTSAKRELSEFILMYLKSDFVTNHIYSHLAGSTQKYISLTELRNLPLFLPDKQLLNDFKLLSEPIFRLIKQNENEISNLMKIRDSLLPKLMSGEIRVPVEEG